MALYDPLSGTIRKSSRQPDNDPTGQYGLGQYGAAPSLGGMSPTGAASYAGLLSIPGTQPDFLGLLNADPLLQQFKAGLGAESVADRSQLAAARQQALARFGLIPELSNSLGLVGSDIGEDITPETRALAEKNTAEGLSVVGRLRREFERVQQNIQDALAAGGALRSGATGVALSDLEQERKTALSDASSQLLDYLAGVQSAYVQSQRQRAMQLAQEQAAAAGRIDPSRLAGTPATEARHVGGGIYQDASGNLYDVNGNRYYGAVPEAPPLVPQPNPQPGQVFKPSPSSGSAAVRAM